MVRNIDRVFDSTRDGGSYFQIASGHISETTIHFEKENILAVIQAEGRAAFYTVDGKLLAAGEVPREESGRGVYQELRCRVQDGKIILDFPIYQWIDNYPNCDSEHDRWDTRIVGAHSLAFNPGDGTVV